MEISQKISHFEDVILSNPKQFYGACCSGYLCVCAILFEAMGIEARKCRKYPQKSNDEGIPKYIIARTRHDEYQYEDIRIVDIADRLLKLNKFIGEKKLICFVLNNDYLQRSALANG